MMKKQLIMKNALDLFAEKGIIATSVQDITDKSNISKGAFYLAFKSKDELINAIVDQFMISFITDSDRIVREVDKDRLLYEFLWACFHFREEHASFSSVYMKEQMHKMNETMLERLLYYDRLLIEILFRLVQKIYEEKATNEQYELVYMIKSFIQLYEMFVIQLGEELQVESFIDSVIEKIELLAKTPTKSFITDNIQVLIQMNEVEVSVDSLTEKMRELSDELEEGIVKDSVQLLQAQLETNNLQEAIVEGLLRNIEGEVACKEIVFLYRKYKKQ